MAEKLWSESTLLPCNVCGAATSNRRDDPNASAAESLCHECEESQAESIRQQRQQRRNDRFFPRYTL